MSCEKMSMNTNEGFSSCKGQDAGPNQHFSMFTWCSVWAHRVLLAAIDVKLVVPHSDLAVLIEHCRIFNGLDLPKLNELIWCKTS